MQSLLNSQLGIIMIVIMIVLLLIIGLLANLLLGAADYYVDKDKNEDTGKNDKDAEREEGENASSAAAAIMMLATLLFFTAPAFAQNKVADAAATAASATIGGISKPVFYIMTGVMFLEIVVIVVLLINVRILLAKQKAGRASVVPVLVRRKKLAHWWNRLNRFKPVQEEVAIDLGHSYDGIRELDNRLPPWWLYSFYITIIFAGIYLWRYHVSHTAPSSEQEFQTAMVKAEEQKTLYLQKAAANVDENTVKLLTQESDLQAGNTVFQGNCAACHGKAGEGLVGPNLTDEYWLHGGSVKDIFKTIKYGVPEKGMKSWKDDFSPTQLAQLSSYIHSLQGTNPPNAKEKQGEVYKEGPSKDSATTNVIAAH